MKLFSGQFVKLYMYVYTNIECSHKFSATIFTLPRNLSNPKDPSFNREVYTEINYLFKFAKIRYKSISKIVEWFCSVFVMI